MEKEVWIRSKDGSSDDSTRLLILPAARAGPGHGLGAHRTTPRTAESPDRSLEVGRASPHGKMTPLPHLLLEAAPHAGPALRAGQEAEAGADVDDQDIVADLDVADPKPWEAEETVE